MTSPDFALRKQQEIRERAHPAKRREMRWCRHDRRMVHAVGPSPAWHWIAPVLGVLGFLAVIAITFVDPSGLGTLVAALLYIAVLGPAIALARRQPRCPDCGREVRYRSEAEAQEALATDDAGLAPQRS